MLGQRAREKDGSHGRWTLDLSIEANADAFCLLPHFAFSPCCCHSLGVLPLPVFKGNCHHFTQPDRLEVQKIRNPSWHEMHCEMCLKIKLLMTTVIKNLLFQMHFSVSRPQRACCALIFQMVGWLCDWQASIYEYGQAHRKVHLCIWLPICEPSPHTLFQGTDRPAWHRTAADTQPPCPFAWISVETAFPREHQQTVKNQKQTKNPRAAGGSRFRNGQRGKKWPRQWTEQERFTGGEPTVLPIGSLSQPFSAWIFFFTLINQQKFYQLVMHLG